MNIEVKDKIKAINQRTIKQIEKITGKLTLGKAIWAIRKCDEISLVECAKKFGCSKQHLCDVEHDRKNVSPRMAAEYAKILGYLPEQFIWLALQGLVDRDKLEVEIFGVKPKTKADHTRISRANLAD